MTGTKVLQISEENGIVPPFNKESLASLLLPVLCEVLVTYARRYTIRH